MRASFFFTGWGLTAGDHGLLGLRLLRRVLGKGGRAPVPTQRNPALTAVQPVDFEGEDTSLTQAELELLK